jgi:hypothetical protein
MLENKIIEFESNNTMIIKHEENLIEMIIT